MVRHWIEKGVGKDIEAGDGRHGARIADAFHSALVHMCV